MDFLVPAHLSCKSEQTSNCAVLSFSTNRLSERNDDVAGNRNKNWIPTTKLFPERLAQVPSNPVFFGEGNHQNCTPSRDLFPNPQGHLIIDRTVSSSFQAGQISPTLFHQAVKTWSLVLSQVRPPRGEGSRPPLQKTNDTFPNDLRLEVYSLSRSPALLIKVGAIR